MDAADCPSENALVEYAEGRLSLEARQGIHRHIDRCADCRALLSDLARVSVNDRDVTVELSSPKAPLRRAPVPSTPTSQRFQILRQLGQGGMGVVYEAIDRRDQSRVAVKTLRSMNPDALLRFKHELRALQDLRHENLVRLGDLVEESGQWWFSMELLQGVDFLTHVQAEPRSESRLGAALLQLAAGLCALHHAGKVHRDIKPSNVLVTTAGRVVILDFGLLGEREQQDSMVVGTLAYMAPEQAAGEPAGSAADWYSVGMMLFQALTGELPRRDGAASPHLAALRAAGTELGILCCELLAKDPAQRPSEDEIWRRLRRGAADRKDAAAAPAANSPLFVGRRAELATLRDALQKRRPAEASLLLIEGESGVGKSALVRHFLSLLPAEAPDVVVLSSRCYEREAVPYKAFDGIIDALARYMKRLPREQAAALLPRRAASLLTAFPVLGMVPAMTEAPPAESSDPKEQRSRVFAALRELLARLGERHPLVLSIDDLQWADGDSLALLQHLLSPPDAPSLLLLSTLRPLAPGHREGLRDELLRQLPAAPRLRLAALPLDDACELAQRLLRQAATPRDLDARALAVEAGGHPLFLDELLRCAQESSGPTIALRLEDAIAARVSALPAAAQRLLRLLALSARPLPQAVALAASTLSTAELSAWISRLQDAHLLRTTPGLEGHDAKAALEPYHDRVREIIAERLDEAERRAMHHALAAALERETPGEPELLALHYHAAGEIKKSGRYAAQAAAQAARQLAFDRAAELYRAALGSGAFSDAESSELGAALAAALANAGRAAEAGRAYLACAERVDAERALSLRQQAANQLLRGGYVEEGIAVMNGLLKSFGLRVGSSQFLSLLKALYLRLRIALRGHAYRLRPLAEVPPRQLLLLDLTWMICQALNSSVLGLRAYEFGFRFGLLALQAGEPLRIARMLSTRPLELLLLGKGKAEEARIAQLFSQARTLLREQHIDDPYTEAMLDVMESATASELGHVRRSRELAERAEQTLLSRCPGTSWEVTNARFKRLTTTGMMGDFSTLSAEMPQLLRESRERSDRFALGGLLCVHSQPYFLAADSEESARATLTSWGLFQPEETHWNHQINHLQARIWFALYFEGGHAALTCHSEGLQRLPRIARMLLIGGTRAPLLLLAITCQLAAIVDGDPNRAQLLRDCDAELRRIRRIGISWSDAWALGLEAGIAAQREKPDAARALLAQAITALDAAELHLHAAACRHQLGALLGAQQGAALVEEANDFMRRQDIKNPARLARTFFPGLAAEN